MFPQGPFMGGPFIPMGDFLVKPGNFEYEEIWEIPGWNQIYSYIVKFINTPTNAKFNVFLSKISDRCIKVAITMINCLESYPCSISLRVLNGVDPTIKLSKHLKVNFEPSSITAEVNIYALIKKAKSYFNEASGFVSNNTFKLQISISHGINATSQPKKRTSDREVEYTSGIEYVPRTRRRINDDSFSIISEKYCGILNQGSTCYMNSILQAFFHLPIFRRILFQMEVDPNQGGSSIIIWNLRQLFAAMSDKTDAVSTRTLTQSFGWEDDETQNHQQDLLEFYAMVLEMIDGKLKGTQFEGEIEKLFYGEQRSHFSCLKVPVNKVSTEAFKNILLNVKDCRSLEESLYKFTEPESISQFKTEEYGFQDAEIRTEFIKFPSVLYFQLKRIEYDVKKHKMVRINSHFEYPLSIDMSQFLADDVPKPDDMIYDLYGILVHAGDEINGHFYAYLRTDPDDDQWYLFNDSSVSFASEQQAVSNNFGGKKNEERQHYSAYILIYMKRKDLKDLFCPVSTDMIHDVVVNQSNNDESSISDDLATFNLYTDASLDPETFKFTKPTSFEVSAHASFLKLYRKVSKRLKINDIRLWYLYNNQIFAPVECVSDEHIESIISSSLFVERFNGIRNDIFSFIGFYSPLFEAPRIRLLRTINLASYYSLSQVIPFIESILDLKSGEPIIAYHQISNCELSEINIFTTLKNLMIQDGSYFIFQLAPQTDQPFHAPPLLTNTNNSEPKGKTFFDIFPEHIPSTADIYFNMINKSIKLYVKSAKRETEIISIPGFFTFRELKRLIAKIHNLDYNPGMSGDNNIILPENHLLKNDDNLSRNTDISSEYNDDIEKEMYFYKDEDISPINEEDYPRLDCVFQQNDVVFYHFTDNLEKSIRVEIIYAESPTKIHDSTTKFFNVNSYSSNLFEYMRRLRGITKSTPLRALQLVSQKRQIKSIITPSTFLRDLKNPLRVEVVPDDQREIPDDSFLIRVRKKIISEKGVEPFDSPFLVLVNHGESFLIVKERIKSIFGVSDLTFGSIYFILKLSGCNGEMISDEIILSDIANETTELIMVYPRKQPQKIGDAEGVTMYN
ncbi:hypothetical protein TRFO_31374 [Tritrichomonas foetus]|uniref:ubiquitinyl hydrolase 1 n=1 Tax=Tritrichomonas foetus TaxID=1144522 RepID=A0A1J4JTG1_9EUKA|nr:hypothetical protein TRFO_31374 [Tritrichomonas foetus]|eukprot:OHT01712.1 hypothetical protein TRFO_31374 [Tritrichomonas foetus]